MSDADKTLLTKGLNFALPPGDVKYADYLVSFEYLYRDIKNLEIPPETRDLLKARIKDCAITSLDEYNKNIPPKNLTKEEFASLISLSKNVELVIQKSDKGNSVVLIDRNVYVDRIKELLSYTGKFNIVNCDKDKELIL